MEKTLVVISNGLNAEQHLFIDKLLETEMYNVEFIPYIHKDHESEVGAYKSLVEKTNHFQESSNEKLTFLFAVEDGSYIIPAVTKEYNNSQIIHIDHSGTRFGFENPVTQHMKN